MTRRFPWPQQIIGDLRCFGMFRIKNVGENVGEEMKKKMGVSRRVYVARVWKRRKAEWPKEKAVKEKWWDKCGYVALVETAAEVLGKKKKGSGPTLRPGKACIESGYPATRAETW